MYFKHLQLVGIRCFEDTGRIKLSAGCNIFVGRNNGGKSTILRAALALQEGFRWSGEDVRKGLPNSFVRVAVGGVLPGQAISRPGNQTDYIIDSIFHGSTPATQEPVVQVPPSSHAFRTSRPNHAIVPFLAGRKAPSHEQTVSLSAQSVVTGTYQNLVARVDALAVSGHPSHRKFVEAVDRIIGLPITTTAAPNGKQVGFYLNDNEFVALERMGDGVTELVAHIVELVLERNKVFILEEPESFLHPQALKALLELVRDASTENQFLIATHSNIVLRELAGAEDARIFRVFRSNDEPGAPSVIERVPTTAVAHRDLLRELGYEFADFGLHEGWLFLEESSAESIFRELLIPWFVPKLAGRLRTFSTAGASNLEPSVSDFIRLVSFVHMQPAYADQMWIRADGDAAGQDGVTKLRARYNYLDKEKCTTFEKSAFELYFPSRFDSKVAEALAIPDKNRRRATKLALLGEVTEWSKGNRPEAQAEWAVSAAEPIALLERIATRLVS